MSAYKNYFCFLLFLWLEDETWDILCALEQVDSLWLSLVIKSGKYGNMLCVKSQFICEYVCQANQVTPHTQKRYVIMYGDTKLVERKL